MPVRIGEEIEFESGGTRCRGWFSRPSGSEGARPCVVLGHGLGLTAQSGLCRVAEELTREGYCTLVFDYRSFGASEGEPRQLISFRGQLEDWASAIAWVRARPSVDPQRLATWGFSLGGGHAVRAAARDGNISAVVAVVPMFSGTSSTFAAMRWWSPVNLLTLATHGLLDLVASALRRRPVLVPLSAPPGDLGLLTSPHAYTGYQAIVPSGFDFLTAARIALYFFTYAPGRSLGALRAPALVMPSSRDKVCPPGPILKRAQRCAHVEVVELSCEHMDALVDPARRQVIDTTLGFLHRHLPIH
ncbi:MAG: alpha/beta fold hydrolase [Myxococcota bacterium]